MRDTAALMAREVGLTDAEAGRLFGVKRRAIGMRRQRARARGVSFPVRRVVRVHPLELKSWSIAIQ